MNHIKDKLKICSQCETSNEMNRFTCINCHYPFYRLYIRSKKNGKPVKRRKIHDKKI